ncbi:hypothetical protein BGZ60DRAFT_400788 [Tricladium varicosporioides]|nr:hypothetical protein BGZ60DRAFT_400788 [Hymenoscyphus varicosporioides]
MSQLSSFPLFSSLPTEIRIQIWSYFLPTPSQVHTLSIFDAQFYNKISEWGHISVPWSVLSASHRPSWAVFQSCREARALATNCYPAREWVHEVANQQDVEALKCREAELRGQHSTTPSPCTTEVRRTIFCSNTDLVILEPFALCFETGEGVRVQVEGGKRRGRYSGIRYLAFWGGDVEGWDTIYGSMFDGLDVIFILGACRATMPPPVSGSQVLVSAPWDIEKHTCSNQNPPVVLQEYYNKYISKDLYMNTEAALFDAMGVSLVVEKTRAKAVVSVCCVRGAMDMIERLEDKNRTTGVLDCHLVSLSGGHERGGEGLVDELT